MSHSTDILGGSKIRFYRIRLILLLVFIPLLSFNSEYVLEITTDLSNKALKRSCSISDTLYKIMPSANTTLIDKFTSSNLPIIIINTNGQEIKDSDRIQADMDIIYKGSGLRNNVTDPYKHYKGKIGIEIRGANSKYYPKKPYRIETIGSDGNKKNVSLLGMPKENDWVLHNPFSDKSLIRNVMAYKISNDIGRYASRTQVCEVILNNDYKGIYVFMEKIKRDKNRVNIAKLKATDLAGDSLTGGYIIKVDKLAGEKNESWHGYNVLYQYDYPKPHNIKAEQKEYIRKFIWDFEEVMRSNQFDDTAIGYPHFIDIEAMVDYYIVNEVTKNVDGYRISAFMYKDRDDKNGKLVMGPVWDFNLSFGIQDKKSYKTENWNLDILIKEKRGGYAPPFWWEKITKTDDFKVRLYRRWIELRKANLQTHLLIKYIDRLANTLDEAQERNFKRWNQEVDYTSEIDYLKEWLTKRLIWMDVAIAEYKNLDTI